MFLREARSPPYLTEVLDRMEKVVITGTGTINSLGHNVKETWGNITNSVSGAAPITLFDTSDYLVKLACEVKDFDPKEYISPREARRMDRFEHFGIIAATQTVATRSVAKPTPITKTRKPMVVASKSRKLLSTPA